MNHQYQNYKDSQKYTGSHVAQQDTLGRQAAQKQNQPGRSTMPRNRHHGPTIGQDYAEPHKQSRQATDGKQQLSVPNTEGQLQGQRMSLATVNQSQKPVSNSERPSLSVISSMDYRRPSQNEASSAKRTHALPEGTRQYQEHSPRGQGKHVREIRSPRDSFGRRQRAEGGYSKSVSMSNSRSHKSRERDYKGMNLGGHSSNFNESEERNSGSEEASGYRGKVRGQPNKVTYGSSNDQSYLVRNKKGIHGEMISRSSSHSPSSSGRGRTYGRGKTNYIPQEKLPEYNNLHHGEDPKSKNSRRHAREESDVYESSQGRGRKPRSSSMSVQAKRRGKAYSSSEKMMDDEDSINKESDNKYKGQSKSNARGGGSSRKLYPPSYLQDEAANNYDNNQNFLYDNRKSKYLSGMSSRQQVKFLMQKTKEETNWVLENDSDIKGGSESSEDDNQQLRDYYGSSEMWRSSFTVKQKTTEDKMKMIRTNAFVQPYIKGIGGTWGTGYQDSYPLNQNDIVQIQESNNGHGDSTEPFMIQYEKRMEYMRRKLFREQLYRIRMLAYSTFQFNPIKQNKFLERKKVIFTKDKARALMCSCQKTKKLSKMLEQKQPQQIDRLQEYLRTRQTAVKTQNNTYNCGEKCFNRGMNCECSLLSCPSDVYCTNRHFQLFQDRFVFPIKTKYKGWGLAAGEFIPKGSFVMQYVGEVFNIDSDLGAQRIQQYKHSTCTYLMRIDNNEVIDPTSSGNIARFINHSCDPNCQTSKWSVLDEVCVGIFAIKDIQENEELTFDYQFDFFKTPCTRCYCGAKNCKLFLGVATGNQSSGSSSDSRSHSSDDNSDKSDYSLKSSANENMNITERPPCFHCKKDIEDSKQLMICKGQCNQLFHVQCAKKLDKALTQQQLQSRKFLCKPCFRIVSGQKKRGRKSNKEITEMMEAKKRELLKDMPIGSKDVLLDHQEETQSTKPSIFQDSETQKVMENSLQNLLIDRVIFLLSRKIEVLMAKVFRSRLQNYQKSSLIRSKKFQQQQFSDHYTFMYELIRRLRPKLRKIVDLTSVSKAQQTLVDDQGPGGCQISYTKFFKEFPQIASCEEDLLKIREAAGSPDAHQRFLDEYFEKFKIGVNEIEEDEMMLEELDVRGKGKLSIKKPKRKYVRKSQLLAEAEEKPKKKRGRPPKKMKDDHEEDERPQIIENLDDGLADTKNDDVIFISASAPKQEVPVNDDVEQPDSSMVIPLHQVQQRSATAQDEHPQEHDQSQGSVAAAPPRDRSDSGNPSEPHDDRESLHDEQMASDHQDDLQPDLQEGYDEDPDSAQSADQVVEGVEGDEADSESNQDSLSNRSMHQDLQEGPLAPQDDDEEPEDELDNFHSEEEDEENESEQQLESEEGMSLEQEESEEQESEQENNDSESDQAITHEDNKSQGSDGSSESSNEDSEENEEDLADQKAQEKLSRIEGLTALKPAELPKYDKSKILFQVQQRRRLKSKDQTQAHLRSRQKSFDSAAKRPLKQRHSIDKQSGYHGFFGQLSESRHQTKEQIIRQEYRQLRQDIADRWEKILEADEEQTRELRHEHELKAQSGGGYSNPFRVDTKASRLNVNQRVFNMVIKNHIDDIECFEHLSLFWEKPWGSNVTLKLISTRFQYVQISSLLQMCTNRVFSLHSKHRIENTLNQFQIQRIQVPKNFIRKLVGYQERTLQYFRMNLSYDVDFFYNRELLVDEIFPMDDFTHLRIFGRKADVNTVSQMLLNKLESIMMKSILIQKVDCNFVMDNVKEIKCLVDPCEVRIKHSEGPYKDLRHPFLYLPNYLRDIILIGTFDEIRVAERKLQGFLRQKREGQNYMMNQQLSFLLPIFLKDHIERIKLQIRHKHFGVQIFHYMPTYPRKHLTISIIGPWAQIISSKQLLLQLSKPFILQQYRSYEHFQGQVFHQQIRFAFKSLKRYILEKDIKYLSHWDIVSVFVDNIGKDFKLDLNEDDIEMLIKQKQREMNDSNVDQSSKGYEVAAMTTVHRSQHTQQESFLDALLQSDKEEEDEKKDAEDAQKQEPDQPKDEDDVMVLSNKMHKSSSLHLPQATSANQLAVQFRQNSWNKAGDSGSFYQIDKDALIQKHIDEIQAMRQNEILQLKNYLRDDDPESCINILFVLSQCKSQEHSSHSRKKHRDADQEEIKDELFSLMQRLDIKKFQLVKYMQQVLNNNLNKFMHSLGKSKNHVKQFESDSSTSQDLQKDSASRRKNVQVTDSRRRLSKDRTLKDSNRKRSRHERKSDSNSKSSRGAAKEDEAPLASRRKRRMSLSRERSPDLHACKRQAKLERKIKETDSRHLKYLGPGSGQKRLDRRPSREKSRSASGQNDSQGRHKGRETREKYSRHSLRKHGEKYSIMKTHQDLMESKHEGQPRKVKRVIIRDGEDFIIKNNQQIPRFGFSKSIDRDEEPQRENNEIDKSLEEGQRKRQKKSEERASREASSKEGQAHLSRRLRDQYGKRSAERDKDSERSGRRAEQAAQAPQPVPLERQDLEQQEPLEQLEAEPMTDDERHGERQPAPAGEQAALDQEAALSVKIQGQGDMVERSAPNGPPDYEDYPRINMDAARPEGHGGGSIYYEFERTGINQISTQRGGYPREQESDLRYYQQYPRVNHEEIQRDIVLSQQADAARMNIGPRGLASQDYSQTQLIALRHPPGFESISGCPSQRPGEQVRAAALHQDSANRSLYQIRELREPQPYQNIDGRLFERQYQQNYSSATLRDSGRFRVPQNVGQSGQQAFSYDRGFMESREGTGNVPMEQLMHEQRALPGHLDQSQGRHLPESARERGEPDRLLARECARRDGRISRESSQRYADRGNRESSRQQHALRGPQSRTQAPDRPPRSPSDSTYVRPSDRGARSKDHHYREARHFGEQHSRSSRYHQYQDSRGGPESSRYSTNRGASSRAGRQPSSRYYSNRNYKASGSNVRRNRRY